MKIKHPAMIVLSGAVWFAVGLYLLPLGLSLILEASRFSSQYPLMGILAPLLGGGEMAAILLIVLGLFVGYMKGKHVLAKAATRSIERIRSLPEPVSLLYVYNLRYYLLLGGMVLLGLSIKWLGIPNDIRGTIDVAIGAALINGAVFYFRNRNCEV